MSPVPSVSVVVTSYNQKSVLKDAIESVMAQSHQPFEVIVCDDASSDGSYELIKNYEERWSGIVHGILHDQNIGVSKNRSSGLATSTGDYVTWLDGDDVFMPGKLEDEIARLMEAPTARWVYSQVRIRKLRTGATYNRYGMPPEGDIFQELAGMVGSAPKSPLVERALLDEVGYFDPQLDLYEDFDLILRLAARAQVAFSPAIGMEYRVHSTGLHTKEKQRHLVALNYIENNLSILALERSPEVAEIVIKRFRKRVNSLVNKRNFAIVILSRIFEILGRFFSKILKRGRV